MSAADGKGGEVVQTDQCLCIGVSTLSAAGATTARFTAAADGAVGPATAVDRRATGRQQTGHQPAPG